MISALRTVLGVALLAASGLGQQPPNVILIVCDDVGFGDFHPAPPVQSPVELLKPNLDQLAADGVSLPRFYAMPACSPTRNALLTGRYPIRWGMQRQIVVSWTLNGLPREQLIFPEMTRSAGLDVNIACGKWHLGHAFTRSAPLRQGFDAYYGNHYGQCDYYEHFVIGQDDWHRDMASVEEDGYHTEKITDEALALMDAAHLDGDSFFVYLPYLAGHVPKQAPQVWIDYYKALGVPFDLAVHWAQLTEMDVQIGRIRQKLIDLGELDDTIIWFLSENGALEPFGDNGELRGGKTEVYEGGIRVPSIVSYPNGGFVPDANGENHALFTVIDVMPTIFGLLDEHTDPVPPRRGFDGVDLTDVLRGAPPQDREFYVFTSRDQEDTNNDYAVVQTENGVVQWKAVHRGPRLHELGPNDPDPQDPDCAGIAELYRIDVDPGEAVDVSGSHPGKCDELMTGLVDDFLVHFRSEGEGYVDVDAPDPGWPGVSIDWDFFDTSFGCVPERYFTFALAGNAHQSVGTFDTTTGPHETTEMSNYPDGEGELRFVALGFHEREGLLYGLRQDGDELDIYQVDAQPDPRDSHVLYLGRVSGLPAGITLRGGDLEVGGDLHDHGFWVCGDDDLFRIDLQNLEVVESFVDVGVVFGDLIVTPSGLRGLDEVSREVVTVGWDGAVTFETSSLQFGACDALWPGDAGPTDTLYAYREASDRLYVIDVDGSSWMSVLSGLPELDHADGAHCSGVF